jgi:putative sporulation protein YyaC
MKLTKLRKWTPLDKEILFVCVGTDRSTGDSLGPLVGTMLQKKGIPAIGTLDNPVHAMNLVETIESLPKDKFIIAIDAALGQLSSVGKIKVEQGALSPGAGVNKELPEIGDMSITGIVNVGGFMEYFVLQGTRLSLVMKLAEEITKACETIYKERTQWKSQSISKTTHTLRSFSTRIKQKLEKPLPHVSTLPES